jgi:hypothetical protein
VVYVPARHFPDGWVAVLDGAALDEPQGAGTERFVLDGDGLGHTLCIAATVQGCAGES